MFLITRIYLYIFKGCKLIYFIISNIYSRISDYTIFMKIQHYIQDIKENKKIKFIKTLASSFTVNSLFFWSPSLKLDF